jgi:hypothetical protein
MDLDKRKARTKEFHDVLEAAMAKYNDVLMPARCTTHGDECDEDSTEFCSYAPVDGMLADAYLVASRYDHRHGQEAQR